MAQGKTCGKAAARRSEARQALYMEEVQKILKSQAIGSIRDGVWDVGVSGTQRDRATGRGSGCRGREGRRRSLACGKR